MKVSTRGAIGSTVLPAKAGIQDKRPPIIAVDPHYFRPTEVETLLGDHTKAKEKLAHL
jgi:GDP-D-mannose dehydratase